MKIKILLLGKDGQLGKEFVHYFKNLLDYEVHAYNRKELDITNRKKLFELAKQNSYNIIINCTAYNKVDIAETEKDDAFNTNYFGVKYLAEIAQINKSKLIHFSTDYVFDGQKDSPYCVYDKPNPLSVYGSSKLFGEKAIRDSYDNYIIIRGSWVFGGKDNFITKLIEWSKQNNKLEIIQDQVSSPTYTFNLVQAVIKLVQENAIGTFHISNTPTSKLNWAKFILKKINWKGDIIAVNLDSINFKAKRPKYAVLDNTLFNNITSWQMPSWEGATIRYLNDLKL